MATLRPRVLPQASVNTFPYVSKPWYGIVRYAPFYTGAFATMSMFFIYTAATRAVKHAQYEIFWFSHHFFVLFYVSLIFHGPVFLYFTIVPIILYIGERLWRIKRSARPIYLKTIKWIAPVLELDFCPKNKDDLNFIEGQYLYINCPYLSINEVCFRRARACVRACSDDTLVAAPVFAVAPVHHLLRAWGSGPRGLCVCAHPCASWRLDRETQELLGAVQPREAVPVPRACAPPRVCPWLRACMCVRCHVNVCSCGATTRRVSASTARTAAQTVTSCCASTARTPHLRRTTARTTPSCWWVLASV